MTLWRGACLLPDIYPEFNREYPNIKIELFEGRFNRLQRALMNNMIDIAVAPMPRSANFGELFYETLLEERIFLVFINLLLYNLLLILITKEKIFELVIKIIPYAMVFQNTLH